MYNIEKIKHGNVDVFTYKGLKTLQVYGVDAAFDRLATAVSQEPFKTIIELGADFGGLTNMLADHPISNKALIYTFDINFERFTNLQPSKVIFYHMDIYSNFKKIIELIEIGGRSLVLCDGGNKALEFATLAPHLKVGDIIMAHDYSPNKQIFDENTQAGRWNWWEFNDENIPHDSNLVKTYDFFDDYVWCLRMKT